MLPAGASQLPLTSPLSTPTRFTAPLAGSAVMVRSHVALVRVRLIARLVRVTDRTIIATTQAERTQRAAGRDMEPIALAFDEALGAVIRRVVEWTLRTPGSVARPAG